MSSPSRRKDTSIVGKLLENPHAYSFFQAVRILERAGQLSNSIAAPGRRLGGGNLIGGFAPPSLESIRLKTTQAFKFPEAEVESVEPFASVKEIGIKSSDTVDSSRWTMAVNFMGLTGAMGVMPFHYTELILQRLKLKDESLVNFLDLFNHRTLSLFYGAATKYRLALKYEASHFPVSVSGTAHPNSSRSNNSNDKHTQALLSLLGLGTAGLKNRLNIPDESLVFYSGLLTQKVRTTSGLKQILQDYFSVPVKIDEFVGQWQELIPDARSRLASRSLPKGQNVQLGRSVMLGHKGWFAQGKLRISMGPLNREQFYQFAPGTRSLQALNEMVRLYVGMENDYDFIIEVNRKDLPKKIPLGGAEKSLMGWNTWLSSTEKLENNRSETLKISVSANRAN